MRCYFQNDMARQFSLLNRIQRVPWMSHWKKRNWNLHKSNNKSCNKLDGTRTPKKGELKAGGNSLQRLLTWSLRDLYYSFGWILNTNNSNFLEFSFEMLLRLAIVLVSLNNFYRWKWLNLQILSFRKLILFVLVRYPLLSCAHLWTTLSYNR